MRASDMSSVTTRSRVRRACRTGSGAGGCVRPAAGGAAGCAPWCRRPRSVARPDEDVGVGVLDLDDEALELEPAKVVAAAALGVGGGVGSEQPGDEDCWPSRNASLAGPAVPAWILLGLDDSLRSSTSSWRPRYRRATSRNSSAAKTSHRRRMPRLGAPEWSRALVPRSG